MAIINKGIIQIDQRIILDFLQFPRGSILSARVNLYGQLELCIYDLEMPVVRVGEPIPVVTPTYTKHQDIQGHWVAIREPLDKVYLHKV